MLPAMLGPATLGPAVLRRRLRAPGAPASGCSWMLLSATGGSWSDLQCALVLAMQWGVLLWSWILVGSPWSQLLRWSWVLR